MATKAVFRAEDLEGIQNVTGRRYELVKGELYEVTTTIRHTEIAAEIMGLLRDWNKRTRSGRVIGDAGFTFERNPDTVRAADAGFIRKGRLEGVNTRRGYPEMAPDLAFEVRSPNDTWAALRRKAEQFMEHGAQMVVMVEPDEYAEVLRPGREPRRLELDDVFEAPDILPGFSCRVRDFFPEEL
jgi:Uma2 family endonuclease